MRIERNRALDERIGLINNSIGEIDSINQILHERYNKHQEAVQSLKKVLMTYEHDMEEMSNQIANNHEDKRQLEKQLKELRDARDAANKKYQMAHKEVFLRKPKIK